MIKDGQSLVAAMRQKYGTQWFKTLAFTQNNTLYSQRGGQTTSQWRQQISVPGKLRIDYLPLTQRSGVLFDGSRVHTFDNGRAIDAQPGVNAALLISADLYVLPLERSTKLLDSLGFDLTKLRRDTWEGQPAFVVGAAAGDSTTSQFWIDSDRLAALRMVQKERRGTRDIDGALRTITAAAERTRDAASTVTQAAERNVDVVATAARGVESIARTAEGHAAAAQEVSASTQEQSAACEQMSSASTQLLAGSTQLRELVGGLKTQAA